MNSDLDVTNGVSDDPVTYFSNVLANICDYTSSGGWVGVWEWGILVGVGG